MHVRDLVVEDLPFLGQMLYEAAMWHPERERPPIEQLLAHPYFAMYRDGWGREGDTGVIAESDDEPAGACWYRFFTDETHGEGYVDAETPELAIAVVSGHRGKGAGSALLDAIADRARGAGLHRIALSVEPENPAKRLYTRKGYVDFEPGDGQGRMVLEL